jgi:hypothetical protein
MMMVSRGDGNGSGMLSVYSGYDPRCLTRAVAAGRENYYLSAVAEHGEPPGIWTGAGCRELGLTVGSEVDGPVLERLYERFIDLRDRPGQDAGPRPEQLRRRPGEDR